ITFNFSVNYAHYTYIRSLCTPVMYSTFSFHSPMILLNKVDFPTFGRPTTAIVGLYMVSPPYFKLFYHKNKIKGDFHRPLSSNVLSVYKSKFLNLSPNTSPNVG